jgi:hypothetical protein
MRFGYGGDEFEEIVNELAQNGSVERHPN